MQKGGKLIGGAATAEVLASSRKVLAPNRGGTSIGLQQYYTPAQAATFISSVVGTTHNVLDLTAGDGALLAPYAASDGRDHYRWGIEIDHDQIAAAAASKRPYRAIHGDVQHVYPMLRALGLQWKVIVANPPFGLAWDVPSLGKGSSTLLAFRMMLGLLEDGGLGVLIAGQARFAREVEPEMGQRLCAVLDVAKLFPGTKEPCSIGFFRNVTLARKPDVGRFAVETADQLSGLAQNVCDAIHEHAGYWPQWGQGYGYDARCDAFAAIQFEHKARLAQREGKPAPYFLSLVGGRVKVALNAYQKLLLAKKDRSLATWAESFDRQSAAYFALQERQWARLVGFAAANEMAIEPALREAVEASLKDTRRVVVPLYPLPEAQRLGYLEDVDNVTCKTPDPEKAFVAGDTYAISCNTDVLRSTEMRTAKVIEAGVAVDAVVPVEVSRKAMQIKIGEHIFTEGSEDMAYILEHFEVPQPGDVASTYPDEAAWWGLILDQVEHEIGCREPGFRYRSFQREDLTRLLFKGRGGLCWEQGLGKALGLGSYARALELAGLVLNGLGGGQRWAREGMLKELTTLAGRCRGLKGLPPHRPDALFIQPQYLVQQFQDEMRRFFGKDLCRVGCLGSTADGKGARPGEVTALGLRAYLRHVQRTRRELLLSASPRTVKAACLAPATWAVTWYEAIGISQRVEEKAATVQTSRRLVTREAEWNHEKRRMDPARQELEPVYSTEACPQCGADSGAGWDGKRCQASLVETRDGKLTEFAARRQAHAGLKATKRRKVCGYVHKGTTRKPACTVLAPLFDFVGVDEATKIQSRDSLTSQAVHAFRPLFRIFSTGTPIKSFVHQLFALLGWALGYGSARFPYDYATGQQRFVDDFSVVETRLDEESLARGRKVATGRSKILPDVSNLLRFWRLVAGAVARRRKADVTTRLGMGGGWTCPGCKAAHTADVTNGYAVTLTCGCKWVGAGSPPITFHPIPVPWGKAQAFAYNYWLDKGHFADHFMRKHPDSPLQSAAAIELFAFAIGQGAKLRWAGVMPDCDPDLGDPDLPDYKTITPELSSFTPGMHRALEEIVTAVRAGKKVLFGSALVKAGPWICERLREMGISACHITTEDGEGKISTLAPMKRAKLIADVQAGKYDVLCVGTGAVAFGYNLQMISEAVVYGLPWDMAELMQFLARIDRLTSQWPINVRVIYPAGSLEERIWGVQKAKGDAADLALDAKINKRQEVTVDTATLLRELQKKGIRLDGTEVAEADIEALWRREVAAGKMLGREAKPARQPAPTASSPRERPAAAKPAARKATPPPAARPDQQVQTSIFW